MNFIAFDLETTGFLAGVDKIVEIGAVKYHNSEVDSVFATLIDPKMSIPEGASRVNGIHDEMVRGKPTIDRILEPFAEFCGDYVMVAHNASFDTQFLTADIKKFETLAPSGVILDTLAMAKKVFPGLPNYKLGTLIQHLNIPAGQFHRAEEDANYCGQLFIRILQKISLAGTVPPIENLIALSGKGAIYFPKIERRETQLNFLDLV